MIRTRERSRPSTSATVCTRMVEDPCPISAAPERTTIEPSKSSLILTVACGSPGPIKGGDTPPKQNQTKKCRPPLLLQKKKTTSPLDNQQYKTPRHVIIRCILLCCQAT